uniref:Alpha-tubulin N-acetyltransferase n=2 Tax=Lygus hesperus TaxID=30085 RepID=A0A0A9WA29_LYGHE
MNFKYPLRTIFKQDITKVTNTLLPEDFTTADKSTLRIASDVVINILDEMGIASAKAQDLQKPITSWEKLRNSDHMVYILVDTEGDPTGNGYVLGILKVGKKNLYVFDLDGECHERNSLCVLDFYIHESVQRTGLGKKLFEHMLEEQDISPDKLAIDRPSHKFLLFLQKHYGLSDVVSQSNNFAVFTGFFDKNSRAFREHKSTHQDVPRKDHDFITNIPSNQENNHSTALSLSTSDYSTGCNRNDYQNSGRHAAFKRESTIGQVIHSYQS